MKSVDGKMYMPKKAIMLIVILGVLLLVGLSVFLVLVSKKTNNNFNEELLEEPIILDGDYLEPLEEEPVIKVIPTATVVSGPTITKFGAPLPKKYMSYKTSRQGLRDVISAANTGGIATSGKWHNGNDYACPDKTPVYATKDGYVFDVWPSYYNGPYKYKGHPIYGGLIIIVHEDSTISLYAHLSFTDVKEGDFVTKGKEIGWSGGVKGRRGSGTSTGPHLHYSIYLDMDSFMEY